MQIKNTKNANAKSDIEIKYRNISVNFKANLIASSILFHIVHSSDIIDHLLDQWLGVFAQKKKQALAKFIYFGSRSLELGSGVGVIQPVGSQESELPEYFLSSHLCLQRFWKVVFGCQKLLMKYCVIKKKLQILSVKLTANHYSMQYIMISVLNEKLKENIAIW